MDKLVLDILPEAFKVKLGTYKYNNWIICLPCKMIRSEDFKKVVKYRHGQDLTHLLNIIK